MPIKYAKMCTIKTIQKRHKRSTYMFTIGAHMSVAKGLDKAAEDGIKQPWTL